MTRTEYLAIIETISNPDTVRDMVRGLSSRLGLLFHYSSFKHEPHAAVETIVETRNILAGFLEEFEGLDVFEEEQKEEMSNE